MVVLGRYPARVSSDRRRRNNADRSRPPSTAAPIITIPKAPKPIKRLLDNHANAPG